MSYIKFSQGFNEVKLNFEFGKTKSINKLVGTTCNELFELIDLQKAGVTKVFKLSQPIDLTIVGDNFEIDTTKVSASLKTKLKVNASNGAKVRFAKRVFKLVTYLNRERKIVTVSELEALLND